MGIAFWRYMGKTITTVEKKPGRDSRKPLSTEVSDEMSIAEDLLFFEETG
jgi:hypothetical protein